MCQYDKVIPLYVVPFNLVGTAALAAGNLSGISTCFKEHLIESVYHTR